MAARATGGAPAAVQEKEEEVEEDEEGAEVKDAQWIFPMAFAMAGLLSPWAPAPWIGFLSIIVGYVSVAGLAIYCYEKVDEKGP
jgi:hypothetical protein